MPGSSVISVNGVSPAGIDSEESSAAEKRSRLSSVIEIGG